MISATWSLQHGSLSIVKMSIDCQLPGISIDDNNNVDYGPIQYRGMIIK